MYDPRSSNILERQLAASLSNSINSINAEDFASGVRRNGAMSLARRNFCIFVLFDLLLVSFVWFILEMVSYNGDIDTLIRQEIVHYSIYDSMFDMVMISATRFTILLLFYGLLKLNTKWFEGITTAGTCICLICKGLYFDWKGTNDKPVAVILLVASFILSWGEVWLFDWKVVPQEELVNQCISRADLIPRDRVTEEVHYGNERLLRTATSILQQSEDNTRFHTPLQSHNVSDDEDDRGRRARPILNPAILELSEDEEIAADEEGWQKQGKDALIQVSQIMFNAEWSVAKKDKHATVYTAQLPNGLYFKIETVVHSSIQHLRRSFFENVENMCSWNNSIEESSKILSLRPHCDLIYQVTKKHLGVDQRDMVLVRRIDKINDVHVLAFQSTTHSGFPPRNKIVRASMGPSCWSFRKHEDFPNAYHVTGVLNMQLKLRLPRQLLRSNIASSLLSTAEGIRGLGFKE